MGLVGEYFEQAENCQDRLWLVFSVHQIHSFHEHWLQVISVLGQSFGNLRNSEQGHVAEILGLLTLALL